MVGDPPTGTGRDRRMVGHCRRLLHPHAAVHLANQEPKMAEITRLPGKRQNNRNRKSRRTLWQRKRTQYHGKIVSAAWKLFYEQGYGDTTVEEIIDLSGTSKGVLYHYFDGKDALPFHLKAPLFDENTKN